MSRASDGIVEIGEIPEALDVSIQRYSARYGTRYSTRYTTLDTHPTEALLGHCSGTDVCAAEQKRPVHWCVPTDR